MSNSPSVHDNTSRASKGPPAMSTETWSARIDWVDECTDEQLAAIAEALAVHHGALNTDSAAGRVSAQLTVQATTLRQAIDSSLAAARDAVHGAHGRFTPVRVDVVDDAAGTSSVSSWPR